MNLRRFNVDGIERFRSQLSALRSEPRSDPDFVLLEDPAFSEPVASSALVPPTIFATKREAGYAIHKLLESLAIPELMKDVGLWSWLALFYIDSLCPPSPSGIRRVRADAHYILNLDYRRVYRHLLRTPYYIVDVIPRFNRIFLNQPVSVHGELIEQVVGGRLYLIRIPSVAETVDRLYYDEPSGKPKRGFTAERRHGNLRTRLPLRIQQLSKNYDIAGMSADQLVRFLGSEFEGWLEN